jgi:hypothetical protein
MKTTITFPICNLFYLCQQAIKFAKSNHPEQVELRWSAICMPGLNCMACDVKRLHLWDGQDVYGLDAHVHVIAAAWHQAKQALFSICRSAGTNIFSCKWESVQQFYYGKIVTNY